MEIICFCHRLEFLIVLHLSDSQSKLYFHYEEIKLGVEATIEL